MYILYTKKRIKKQKKVIIEEEMVVRANPQEV
jgi:hypothetical protein